MVTRVYETRIQAPVEALRAFHESVEALVKLTPPGTKVEIIGEDVAVREGALHVLRIRQGPLTTVWKARLSEVSENGFVDVMEAGPAKSWRHHHEFLPDGAGCLLRDTVTFQAPGGPFSPLVHKLFLNRQVDAMFAHRHRVTKQELEQNRVQPGHEA